MLHSEFPACFLSTPPKVCRPSVCYPAFQDLSYIPCMSLEPSPTSPSFTLISSTFQHLPRLPATSSSPFSASANLLPLPCSSSFRYLKNWMRDSRTGQSYHLAGPSLLMMPFYSPAKYRGHLPTIKQKIFLESAHKTSWRHKEPKRVLFSSPNVSTKSPNAIKLLAGGNLTQAECSRLSGNSISLRCKDLRLKTALIHFTETCFCLKPLTHTQHLPQHGCPGRAGPGCCPGLVKAEGETEVLAPALGRQLHPCSQGAPRHTHCL